MEKPVSTKGSTVPSQVLIEYFDHEVHDLEAHIANFDDLIKEIEQKLHKKSEQALIEESSAYAVNIADLENGLDIWKEKCKEAEQNLKECLLDRSNLSKNIEKTLDEIENLKQPYSDVKYMNEPRQNSVNIPTKKSSVLKEKGNHKPKNNDLETSMEPLNKLSNTVTTSTPNKLTNTSTENCKQANSNVSVKAATIFKSSQQQTDTEEASNKTKFRCNISIPDDMLSVEPININVLTCKMENSENDSPSSTSEGTILPETLLHTASSRHDRNSVAVSSKTTLANVISNAQTAKKYNQLSFCDASTQTQRCQLKYSDDNERQEFNNLISVAPVKERPAIRSSVTMPFPTYVRQHSDILSNIYQRVASNEMFNAKQSNRNFNRNERLEYLMNKWMYDCTNPEEYFYTAQLDIKRKNQNCKLPNRKPDITPMPYCGAYQKNYSPISSQTVSITKHNKGIDLPKQTMVTMYGDDTNNMNPIEKLPFSFGENRGWYRDRGEIHKVMKKKSQQTFEISSCDTKSKPLLVTDKSKEHDKSNLMKDNVKGLSEFHRNCATPITVRIIKRLEKQKFKRLSPIRHKTVVVKRYPISPKFRKPRTYVSAFRRKLKSMSYNA